MDHAVSMNASTLVELVESGLFLTDSQRTAREVRQFIDNVLERMPKIDTFTLSSTHLPWLHKFFEDAFPALNFLDPADDVVEQIGPFTTEGVGIMACLASESGAFPISGFQRMLDLLGIPLTAVRYPFLLSERDGEMAWKL